MIVMERVDERGEALGKVDAAGVEVGDMGGGEEFVLELYPQDDFADAEAMLSGDFSQEQDVVGQKLKIDKDFRVLGIAALVVELKEVMLGTELVQSGVWKAVPEQGDHKIYAEAILMGPVRREGATCLVGALHDVEVAIGIVHAEGAVGLEKCGENFVVDKCPATKVAGGVEVAEVGTRVRNEFAILELARAHSALGGAGFAIVGVLENVGLDGGGKRGALGLELEGKGK